MSIQRISLSLNNSLFLSFIKLLFSLNHVWDVFHKKSVSQGVQVDVFTNYEGGQGNLLNMCICL